MAEEVKVKKAGKARKPYKNKGLKTIDLPKHLLVVLLHLKILILQKERMKIIK